MTLDSQRTVEVDASVFDGLTGHELLPGFVHTDFQAAGCACTSARPASHAVAVWPNGQVHDPVKDLPPRNAALPDGGVCFKCGGFTVRTGSCTTCTSCGTSGGCG